MNNLRYILLTCICGSVPLCADFEQKDIFVDKQIPEKGNPAHSIVVENQQMSTHDMKEQNCFKYGGVFVTGDYLYWQVLQDNTDYISRGTYFPGTIHSVDFDGQSGFRVGLGARLSKNSLFEIKYTYFSPSGSNELSGDQTVRSGSDVAFGPAVAGTLIEIQNGNLYPMSIAQFNVLSGSANEPAGGNHQATGAIGINYIQKASSKLDLDYNMIDIKGKTQKCFSKYFDLGFNYGIRLAYIKEDMKNRYHGTLVLQGKRITEDAKDPQSKSDHFQSGSLITLSQKWKYDCVGLRGGFGGNLQLFKGLSIKSDVDVALLVGKMRVSYSSRSTLDNKTTSEILSVLGILLDDAFISTYNVHGSEGFFTIIPNIEALLGLDYECKMWDRTLLNLFAGYEMSYWINLAQFRRNLNSGLGGVQLEGTRYDYIYNGSMESSKDPQSVALHGLTVRASLKF